jgi:hypothetical protein
VLREVDPLDDDRPVTLGRYILEALLSGNAINADRVRSQAGVQGREDQHRGASAVGPDLTHREGPERLGLRPAERSQPAKAVAVGRAERVYSDPQSGSKLSFLGAVSLVMPVPSA